MRCARAKQGEAPPGAKAPIDCGFSHRWIIGWGEAGKNAAKRIAAAVERARMRRVLSVVDSKQAARTRRSPMDPKPQTANQRRQWTVEELDAELERIARERTDRGS